MGTLGTFNNQIKALAASLNAAHLEDIVEIQGSPQTVKAGAHIGGGGGNVNFNPLSDPGAHHGTTSAAPSVSGQQHARPAGRAELANGRIDHGRDRHACQHRL